MISGLLKLNIRLQIALVLVLVYLFSILFQPQSFYLPILSVLSALGTEVALFQLFKSKFYLPYSALITGLLIGLNLDYQSSFVLFILLPSLAILGKNFSQKFFKIHIFNPAAIGLFLGSFIFMEKTTWWAVSSNPYSPIIIALGAGYVLWRIKRLVIALTFLSVYYLFIFANVALPNLSVRSLLDIDPSFFFDPTILLFAFIMLPEPHTSPAQGFWKWLWGPFVAVILIFYTTFTPFKVFDPLIISLLVANLVNFRNFLRV